MINIIMASNSEIILNSTTHVGDSSEQVVTGLKYKGDGYYGRFDGLHTVQYTFIGLTGTIYIEATLEINPLDSDWFVVHQYTATQETNSKIANFTGNYVWIRAYLVFSDGTVTSIVLNH